MMNSVMLDLSFTTLQKNLLVTIELDKDDR